MDRPADSSEKYPLFDDDWQVMEAISHDIHEANTKYVVPFQRCMSGMRARSLGRRRSSPAAGKAEGMMQERNGRRDKAGD